MTKTPITKAAKKAKQARKKKHDRQAKFDATRLEARKQFQVKFGLPDNAAYMLRERGKFKEVKVLNRGTVAVLNKGGSKLVCVVRFLNRRPNDPRGPTSLSSPSMSTQPNSTNSATNPQTASTPTTAQTTAHPESLPTRPTKRARTSPSTSQPSPNETLDAEINQLWHDYHLCIRVLYMLATRRGKIHQNSAMKQLGELIQGPMWGVGWRSSAPIGKHQKGSKIGTTLPFFQPSPMMLMTTCSLHPCVIPRDVCY